MELSLTPTCMYLYEELVLLFQRHQCEECEETGNATRHVAVPLCGSVEAMLSHMKYCRAGMSCKILVCRESREIVSHLSVCTENDCPVILNLGTGRTEWTQKLLQQIGRCSANPEIHGFEVGSARRQLFELFHLKTCPMLNNGPNSLNSSMQGLFMLTLLFHSRHCTRLPNCSFPFCKPLQLLMQHFHSSGGNTCMVCQPLQALLLEMCRNQCIYTVESQRFVRIGPNMEGLIPNVPIDLNHTAAGIQEPSVQTSPIPSEPSHSAADIQEPSVRTRKNKSRKIPQRCRIVFRSKILFRKP